MYKRQLLKVRREKLANLQEAGQDPFQITKYDVTHHTSDVKELYNAQDVYKRQAWYTAGYPHGARLRVAINQVENYEQLETRLMEYFV